MRQIIIAAEVVVAEVVVAAEAEAEEAAGPVRRSTLVPEAARPPLAVRSPG
jgi:hypothetical protein